MTEVETFEVQEVAAEHPEVSEEAQKLIEEMGLEGQKSFQETPEGESTDTRCPYRELTDDERFVYRVHCPKETSIEKYSGSPIPLRVLQIAAHAKEWCPYIYVWDRSTDLVKDPVLVGQTHKNRWESGNKLFILARWGEELEAFSTLREKALKMWREKALQELTSLKTRIESASDSVIISKEPNWSAGYF